MSDKTVYVHSPSLMSAYRGLLAPRWKRQILVFQHVLHVPHHLLHVSEPRAESGEKSGWKYRIVPTPWYNVFSVMVPGAVPMNGNIPLAESPAPQGLYPSVHSRTKPGHHSCSLSEIPLLVR